MGPDDSVVSQFADGLSKIDHSFLPGKFKVWCYQFTLPALDVAPKAV